MSGPKRQQPNKSGVQIRRSRVQLQLQLITPRNHDSMDFLVCLPIRLCVCAGVCARLKTKDQDSELLLLSIAS